MSITMKEYKRLTLPKNEDSLSERGVEFMTTWVQNHVQADVSPLDDDVRAESFAEKCIFDAEKAGISVAEIEEDVGDLETYILEAMEEAMDAEALRQSDSDA